jgi:hypothetical protein
VDIEGVRSTSPDSSERFGVAPSLSLGSGVWLFPYSISSFSPFLIVYIFLPTLKIILYCFFGNITSRVDCSLSTHILGCSRFSKYWRCKVWGH